MTRVRILELANLRWVGKERATLQSKAQRSNKGSCWHAVHFTSLAQRSFYFSDMFYLGDMSIRRSVRAKKYAIKQNNPQWGSYTARTESAPVVLCK